MASRNGRIAAEGGTMASPQQLALRVLSLRAAPMLIGYGLLPPARRIIDQDVLRWQQALRRDERGVEALLLLLTARSREFRNLYYHRLTHQGGPLGQVLAVVTGLVFRPEATLFLDTAEIGPGLFIQHGFATMVAARRIGANCWINQQVTSGYASFLGAPSWRTTWSSRPARWCSARSTSARERTSAPVPLSP